MNVRWRVLGHLLDEPEGDHAPKPGMRKPLYVPLTGAPIGRTNHIDHPSTPTVDAFLREAGAVLSSMNRYPCQRRPETDPLANVALRVCVATPVAPDDDGVGRRTRSGLAGRPTSGR
jgi:hypothetical protein